jgi:hypothetical protein
MLFSARRRRNRHHCPLDRIQERCAARNLCENRSTTVELIMKALFFTFFDICLLKRGPEVVPTHPLFMAMLVGAYVLINVIVTLAVNEQWTTLAALTYTVVTMSAIAAATWFILYLRNLDRRFPATIAALYGCEVLLTTVLYAILQIAGRDESAMAAAAIIVIGIWYIAVSGYILQRALGITLMLGILLALGITLFSVGLGDAAAR